jgi:drug/metabolite transporter (DMT)-like permease
VLTGLLIALAAALCFELSYVLQALEVRAVPAMHRPGFGPLRRLASRPRWMLGIILGLGGFVLQVLALRHAPLTLVQPVLASGLLVLLGFSVLVLHERVGKRELAAVVAIIAGVTAIALANPERGHSTNAKAFTIVVVVLGLVAAQGFVRRHPGVGTLLASAIAADAIAALAAAQAARSLPDPLPSVGWGLLAAAGGVVTLAAESAALQRRGAARIAPVVMAGQVAVPVALAPLLLGERWSASPLGAGLLLAGLAAVVISSAVLAASPVVLATGGEGEHEVRGGGEVGDVAR